MKTDETLLAASGGDRLREVLVRYPGWDEDTNLSQLLGDFVAYCGESGLDPVGLVQDAVSQNERLGAEEESTCVSSAAVGTEATGRECRRTGMDKVRMRLEGMDGNAFAVLGEFQQQARRQGWAADEIRAVVEKATAGNYSHLLATIAEYIEDGDPAEG